jgi:hypothetical protein
MATEPTQTVAGNIALPGRSPPQAGSKPGVTCQAGVRRRTAASTAGSVPARSTRCVAEGLASYLLVRLLKTGTDSNVE